jgi:hypothetical protein
MSSFYYGVSNTRREQLATEAVPDLATAGTASAPSKVADVISAIVPAEALLVYSSIVVPNVTTTGPGGMTTTISDSGLFKAAIVALAVLSGLLYLAGRLKGGKLNGWDAPRVLIPAIAFLCWSGLQTPSGLHLILTSISANALVVFGALAGIALAAVAAAIGYKADPTGG